LTNTPRRSKPRWPELGHKPSEYVTGGRYFQSIEIPEGARLTNAVIDLVGDHVLMYASDYSHGESHFPESVSLVLDWAMDTARKRKLFWDNAIRFYARAPV
jgi:predicted TIM-barrel fold metal-dependent hydrolase